MALLHPGDEPVVTRPGRLGGDARLDLVCEWDQKGDFDGDDVAVIGLRDGPVTRALLIARPAVPPGAQRNRPSREET